MKNKIAEIFEFILHPRKTTRLKNSDSKQAGQQHILVLKGESNDDHRAETQQNGGLLSLQKQQSRGDICTVVVRRIKFVTIGLVGPSATFVELTSEPLAVDAEPVGYVLNKANRLFPASLNG